MASSSLRRSLRPLFRSDWPLPLSLMTTFSLAAFSSSSSTAQLADKFYSHLLTCSKKPESTLAAMAPQLDSACVYEVLHKCSSEKQTQLGLRFFVWAGQQSNYRHSGYMYGKACKLFSIDRNPERIAALIEGYRAEAYAVNVKMFRVIFSLCREARAKDEALWVLRKMKEFGCRPDTIMYNVVIRLFREKGDLDTAMGLLREMGLLKLYPDLITYVEMIKGLCNIGRVDDACDLIKYMKSSGCTPNSVVYSALLDGICRCGNSARALELLEVMENERKECSPNVITYTSVIQSFCEKGQSLEALSILDRMENFGCAPNRVTVSTLIKGLCSHGYVDEAYKLVDRVANGGYVSSSKCYSPLVISLLGINRLVEAEKLFGLMLTSMVRPDGLACSTLVRKICEEGRFVDAFDLVQSLEMKGFLLSIDSDVYSLILDGLSRENLLVEASELTDLMVKKGISVEDSCSHA